MQSLLPAQMNPFLLRTVIQGQKNRAEWNAVTKIAKIIALR